MPENQFKMLFLYLLLLYVMGVHGYPTIEPLQDDNNCIQVTEKQQQINEIVSKITAFINDISVEYDDIDLRLIEIGLDKHSNNDNDKDTLIKVSINDCADKTTENDQEADDKQVNNDESVESTVGSEEMIDKEDDSNNTNSNICKNIESESDSSENFEEDFDDDRDKNLNETTDDENKSTENDDIVNEDNIDNTKPDAVDEDDDLPETLLASNDESQNTNAEDDLENDQSTSLLTSTKTSDENAVDRPLGSLELYTSSSRCPLENSLRDTVREDLFLDQKDIDFLNEMDKVRGNRPFILYQKFSNNSNQLWFFFV